MDCGRAGRPYGGDESINNFTITGILLKVSADVEYSSNWISHSKSDEMDRMIICGQSQSVVGNQV